MKLKKGDQVKMLSGKDRGKTGKILRVMREEGRIIVESLNVFKKRSRPKRQGQKGEIVSIPRAFSFSKAMLVCPNCKAATRVGFRFEGDEKARYCKKCEVAL